MLSKNIVGIALLIATNFSHYVKAVNIDFFNHLIEINENRMLIDRNNLLVTDLGDTEIFKFKLQYEYKSFANDIIVIDNYAKNDESKRENSILQYAYDAATNSIDIDIKGIESTQLDLDIIIQLSHTLLNNSNQVAQSLSEDVQFMYFPINKLPLTNYHIDKFESTLMNLVPGSNRKLKFSDGEETFIKLKEDGEYILKTAVTDLNANFDEMPEAINVYFEFSTALLTVKKIIRNVYLSHWSNTIHFDEHYIIQNEAPKLAKTFKRKEYMTYQSLNQGGTGLALSQLDVLLPIGSFDHYYKDDLGMITTMKTAHHPRTNFDTLALKPRYPILGSWNYIFNIGWFNKLEQFSHFLESSRHTENQEFLLELPVVDGANNLIYQDVTVNVVLPEGVKIKSIYAPDLNMLPGNDRKPKIEFNKFENLFDYSEDKSTEIKITYSDVSINSNLLRLENSDNKIFIKYEVNNFKVYYEKVLRLAVWIFVGLVSIYLLGIINDNLQK